MTHPPIGLAAVAFVLLASCSGGADPTTTAPPVSTSTTSASAATTTPASGSTTSTEPATTTTTAAATETVLVFFGFGDGSDCSMVKGFTREVPADVDPVRSAFDQLVAGPTEDEMVAGGGSFFSEASAGSVLATAVEDGFLSVDFDDFRSLLNNASTSCGSESLLGQLNTTAFQFEEVERVGYSINDNCSTFFNWLQRECQIIER
ncbi:MAG: GerMN domain-containing protein [Acidimicrobiia bacterium]|nr:GerMN domain-containing protein [Acidimicrobiia bacterium]